MTESNVMKSRVEGNQYHEALCDDMAKHCAQLKNIVTMLADVVTGAADDVDKLTKLAASLPQVDKDQSDLKDHASKFGVIDIFQHKGNGKSKPKRNK